MITTPWGLSLLGLLEGLCEHETIFFCLFSHAASNSEIYFASSKTCRNEQCLFFNRVQIVGCHLMDMTSFVGIRNQCFHYVFMVV